MSKVSERQTQLKKQYRQAFAESEIGRDVLTDLLKKSKYSLVTISDGALTANAHTHLAGQRFILNYILGMADIRLEDLIQPSKTEVTKI